MRVYVFVGILRSRQKFNGCQRYIIEIFMTEDILLSSIRFVLENVSPLPSGHQLFVKIPTVISFEVSK